MSCVVCHDPGENIGTEGAPIMVHKELGACWEGGFHAFQSRTDPLLAHIRRVFWPRGQKAGADEED